MARPESIAVGGYFPTPPHLIGRLAALIAPVEFPKPKTQWESKHHRCAFVDPCAGTGHAVRSLMLALTAPEPEPKEEEIDPNDAIATAEREAKAMRAAAKAKQPPQPPRISDRFDLFACELEETRFEALHRGSGHYRDPKLAHCDAFRVSYRRDEKLGASCLFLNPPYDTDRQHGRMEERFLARFTDVLIHGGLLVFLVPFYALAASARTLATHYEDVRCYRFPEEDFAGYKQVVLYAKRRAPRMEPDPKIAQQVVDWSANASTIPELPLGGRPHYTLPVADTYRETLAEWKERVADTAALCRSFKLWHASTRGSGAEPSLVETILPALPVTELLLRKYPVATPPRPAHIAAGIASGLFNGARIEPSESAPKNLPPLLVKGVFDREYKTIEEKRNKDGDVRAVVQIQQPKLVVTVLNLKTYKYSTLVSGVDVTSATEVDKFSAADLLKHYGDSLMGVMQEQCPVLYDPRRDAASIPLAESPRKLFTAQGHATRAVVKLLRSEGVAILIGEIGSGKSSVALIADKTVGSRRPLILCPPHLLTGWREQIEAVAPEAEVHVLATVGDIEAYCASTAPLAVAILSREAAKLGHAWKSVGATCPKCGNLTPSDVDFAKKRARCDHRDAIPSDALARDTRALAIRMLPYSRHAGIPRAIGSRFVRRMFAQPVTPDYRSVLGELDGVIEHLLVDLDREGLDRAIVYALLAAGDDERMAWVIRSVLERNTSSELARTLLLMLPPDHPEMTAIPKEYPGKSYYASVGTGTYGSVGNDVKERLDKLSKGETVKAPSWGEGVSISRKSGKLTVDGYEPRSLDAMEAAYDAISRLGVWRWGRVCREFLYQAVPDPRRVALAKHITRYYPHAFDFLVLDEGHEYGSDTSAQGFAAHRLSGLGLPTVLMTGSLMNGYAESLFMNMWALSRDFRAEFSRDDKQRYIDRYGYRKRILEDRESDGTVVEFGSMSDRVTRCERIVGSAPGILPLFLLRHLLPIAVTLHKADLALDLPPCKLSQHEVDPGSELKKRYEVLKDALVKQIKKDRFDEEKVGKLFGQLAELPSYLDRATVDVGNCESGDFEIRYPESLDSKLVVSQQAFSMGHILPKEDWMLSQMDRELAEGRNVMIFTWHVGLLPRIARLIEEKIGVDAPILYADKVPTGKRQDWITREIVKKGRRVLIANPVAIQTGLNNLVHFATEIWLENPACNPITFRQAMGRVDRIGQTRETRILFPVYTGTFQEQLYDLLMKKVAVSVSTDGLDPESALAAAGLGDDEMLTGLSIGKQLWSMIGGMDDDGPAKKSRTA